MQYPFPTNEASAGWNAQASTRQRVDLCDGHLTVVGSGLPAHYAPVQLVLGPASLNMREEEAIALARALIDAVRSRRHAFGAPVTCLPEMASSTP